MLNLNIHLIGLTRKRSPCFLFFYNLVYGVFVSDVLTVYLLAFVAGTVVSIWLCRKHLTITNRFTIL